MFKHVHRDVVYYFRTREEFETAVKKSQASYLTLELLRYAHLTYERKTRTIGKNRFYKDTEELLDFFLVTEFSEEPL